MRAEVQCVPEFEDDLDPLRRPDPAYRQTEKERIAKGEVRSNTFDDDLPRFEACNYAFRVPTDICCMAESDYLFIAEKGS